VPAVLKSGRGAVGPPVKVPPKPELLPIPVMEAGPGPRLPPGLVIGPLKSCGPEPEKLPPKGPVGAPLGSDELSKLPKVLGPVICLGSGPEPTKLVPPKPPTGPEADGPGCTDGPELAKLTPP